jgi:uncharacterized protein (UPF0332 family)
VSERLDELRALGRLQDIPADPQAISRLLEDADRHLRTAALGLEEGDLAGSYQLAYDAARKSLTAMLLSRGMRSRGLGAHATLIEAVREMFADEASIQVIRPLERMRRVRNDAEYSGHPFDHDEVEHDLEAAAAIVAFAADVLRRSP